MSEPLQTFLWVLVGIALLALVYPLQRDWRETGNFRRHKERQAYCAYCIYRDGEDCTNPKSPVYAGPIGEACIGRIKCKVREAAFDGPLQQE